MTARWAFWHRWNAVPETKRSALANAALRILFAPVSIAIELVHIPGRLIDDEIVSSSNSDGWPEHEVSAKKPIRIPWLYKSRFQLCWADSATVLLQSTFYFILLEILATFGLQHLLRLFRDDIERLQATVTGNWYVTKGGRKLALSPSSGDPKHSIHGHCFAANCSNCGPGHSGSHATADCPLKASFMAACCKLSYECRGIIEDVVIDRWKLSLLAYSNVPADIHLGQRYAPDMVYFAAGNPQGIVIAFTGAQVWLKIDRQTDILTELVSVQGSGKIMRGFVEVFDKPDPCPSSSPSSSRTVYTSLEAIIAAAPQNAEVYLTGHSLGGASAVAFAILLRQRNERLSERVTGIFTFGAPRIGDADFAASAATVYGGRLFRYVCGADMITKLPHAVHGVYFHHHKGLRFITSDSRVRREEGDNAAVQKLVKSEDRWAYLLNAKKTLRACMKGQFGAAVSRLVLFALPGLSDHFLTEYQEAIDKELSSSLRPKQRQ